MSELKAFEVTGKALFGRFYTKKVYDKSEADKVIAELEAKRDTTEKLLNKALDCVSNGKNHIISLARKNNHSNYKRCVAMAKICENKLGTVVKPGWWDKWRKRWLEFAEKFKEAK